MTKYLIRIHSTKHVVNPRTGFYVNAPDKTEAYYTAIEILKKKKIKYGKISVFKTGI